VRIYVLIAMLLMMWLSGTHIATATEPPHDRPAIEICDASTEPSLKDCLALVALYDSTDGGNWTRNDGWLDNDGPCRWYGVICSDGRVDQVLLADNNLTGTLPPQLGDLEPFKLDLSMNRIGGEIPSALGNLTGSAWIGIGQIDLSDNELTGSIPPELGNMSLISAIDLSGNQLTGSIPGELGNLDGQGMYPYIYLNLSHNQLSGPIPAELGQMADQALFGISWDFSHNQLTGTLPVGLVNPSEVGSVNSLDISNNPLSGPLPEDFATSQISVLYFDDTDICEPGQPTFQEWLYGLPRLRSSNKSCACESEDLTSVTAAECDGLVALYKASGGGNWTQNSNWLVGSDPCDWFGVTCSGGAVREIVLAANGLKGVVSPAIAKLVNLQRLHLQQNQLFSILPENLVNLAELADLRFDDTALCEPASVPFQEWLEGIAEVQSTNEVCTATYFPLTAR